MILILIKGMADSKRDGGGRGYKFCESSAKLQVTTAFRLFNL
jgi:hypothetical protein